MAKMISQRNRLYAFAHYTMASSYYAKAREFELAASQILGAPEGEFLDQISDGIYGYEKPLPFDEVLKRAGIKVRQPKKTAGQR